MSKKVKFQTVVSGSDTLGQQILASDLQKLQSFINERVDALADAMLVGSDVVVNGFDLTLLGGMSVRVAFGSAWDSAGKQYLLENNQDLTIAAADPSNPRIDVIHMTLGESQDAVSESRTFKNLTTSALSQQTVFTEEHNLVTVAITQGTPSSDPAIPNIPAGAVALYQIFVPAAASALDVEDVFDNRLLVTNILTLASDLSDLSKQVDAANAAIASHRHGAAGVDVNSGFYGGRTVEGALNLIAEGLASVSPNQSSIAAGSRPEIQTSDGKIGSTAVLDTGVGKVRIPEGIEVDFSGKLVKIDTPNFPTSLNAAVVATGNAFQLTDTLTTLDILDPTQSPLGKLTFNLQSPGTKPSARMGAGLTAYDDKHLILFGGFDGSSYLADVWEYDADLDTWTQLTPSGTLPSARSRHVQIYIGGGKILIGLGRAAAGLMADWFIYDTATSTFSTINPSSSPSAREDATAADLSGGKFLIRGGRAGNSHNFENWIFDSSNNSFVQTAPSNNPQVKHLVAAGYAANKVILFGSRRTFLYDSSTNSYTELNVSGPEARKGHRLVPFESNVLLTGGDKKFIGGVLDEVWLFDTSKMTWSQIQSAGLEKLKWHATDTVIGANGRTKPVVFGGQTRGGILRLFSDNTYVADQQGFTLGTVGSKTGLQLVSGILQGSGVRDLLTHSVDLDAVVVSLDADIPAGSLIKVFVSVDDGANFFEVQLGKSFTFSTPGKQIRWKLQLDSSHESESPTVFSITLSFQESGGSASTFIQFDADGSATNYLMMDETGQIIYSATKVLTKPDQVLLAKVVESTGNAPTITDYENRRVLVANVQGAVSGGAATLVLNWGTDPRMVDATSFDGTSKAMFQASITSQDHESVVVSVTSGTTAKVLAVA